MDALLGRENGFMGIGQGAVEVPVYHVCQHCGGDGCPLCSDLMILEGDIQLDPELDDEIRYVLCQDCLRVQLYTDALHQTEGSCSCGGDMCGCGGCHQDASRLMVGVRDSSLFDFRVPVDLTGWTAEKGVAK